MELKERILAQLERAEELMEEINTYIEDEVSLEDVLDSLARLGYELTPITDHNTTSYAYFTTLGMDMDNLLQQATGAEPA
jgi:ATP-dependent RNA circularization protein (DNA/RNA ligase family)